jgi:hypothetical protein
MSACFFGTFPFWCQALSSSIQAATKLANHRWTEQGATAFLLFNRGSSTI